MARRKQPSHLGTIEYIGPRPQKPVRRPNFLAGWMVLLIAAGSIYYFGKPLLVPLLQAQENAVTPESADLLITELQSSAAPGERLASAALQSTKTKVTWDEAYYQIPATNGDIPLDRGKAEDLIVRSYRALGIDLQELVHKDMKASFADYPQIFGRSSADPNIDHRLTPNLQRFFRRAGAELSQESADGQQAPSMNSGDYQPGDVVAWRLAGGGSHIGIVVPGPGDKREERWVVHNNGQGPVWENCLFDFKITGHYRYFPQAAGN
ncbi:MAG: hypothetical protein RLZ97_1556 [Verrucomicrobiota bacterium]|jgi:uncharacterized protein YijF (DUF1287 family)